MEKTPHLNLVKPAPNTTNWGHALNLNFDNLDTYYAGLSNQVASLRTQMGQLGLYYSDPQYSEYLTLVCVYNSASKRYEVSHAYIQSLDAANPQIITIYQNTVSGYQRLSYLVDYSMFLIRLVENDNELLVNESAYMQGIMWSNDDIAVKITRYDATLQQNTTDLCKMPQSVGGYYQPIEYYVQNKLPVLRHQRKNALEAATEYAGPALFVLPTDVSGNKITFRFAQHKPNTTAVEYIPNAPIAAELAYPQVITEAISFTITRGMSGVATGISVPDYILTDVCFLLQLSDGNKQHMLVDYQVREDTQDQSAEYYIIVDTSHFTSTTTAHMRVSYAPREDE